MIQIKDPKGFEIPEPRIPMIARQIERLLSLVEFECDGRSVRVNGFRLRDLGKWRTGKTITAMNALTPISSVCNSRCSFCFEENVPYPRESSLMSVEEARTRLRHYSPETGEALFPSSRHHMETFVHPQAVEIIELARQRQPDKLFWITTNGTHFTEEVVARLARLKPLIFKLSLNAADPAANQGLMGHTSRHTEIAVHACELLQKYRIPFMGGIVAWPTLSWQIIEETIRHFERFDAYAIRIRLPLSHKWLKQQLPVDFRTHWAKMTELAMALRSSVTVPLFVEPPIYSIVPIIPFVDGVVKGSPAAFAGLKAGDIIRSINGQTIRTRIESEAVLDNLHARLVPEIDIEFEHEGRRIKGRLTEDTSGRDTYPYSSRHFYRGENYGIFHVEDFRLNHVQKLISVIQEHGAREPLLFSSDIVAPIFETIVQQVPEFFEALQEVNLHLEVVKENSFGGNYDVMDSRVVSDYARVIRDRMRQGDRFDLILIPDAFGNNWGTDVYGASVSDLEREFKIPVERIDWLLVYGREV